MGANPIKNPQRHAPGPMKIIPVNDARALPRTLEAWKIPEAAARE